MFPNVRLMVVAILAAITGISCGLGLFAAFRVNHEPLARLAEGSPRLALNNRALGSEAGAPLEAGLPGKDAARLISVPVILVAPSPAPSREPSPAPEQSGADSALAGDSSVQKAAAQNQSKTASLAAPPSNSIRRRKPSRLDGRRQRYRISNRPLRRRPRLQPSKRRLSMPQRRISSRPRSRKKRTRARRQGRQPKQRARRQRGASPRRFALAKR